MLTEDQFKGKLVVVMAGYEEDMDDLMRVNQGLRSRFSRKIHFKNFSVDDCCALMRQELQKYVALPFLIF